MDNYNKIMISDYILIQRNSDKFFDANYLLFQFNHNKNNPRKRMSDFFKLSFTKTIIKNMATTYIK